MAWLRWQVSVPAVSLLLRRRRVFKEKRREHKCSNPSHPLGGDTFIRFEGMFEQG